MAEDNGDVPYGLLEFSYVFPELGVQDPFKILLDHNAFVKRVSLFTEKMIRRVTETESLKEYWSLQDFIILDSKEGEIDNKLSVLEAYHLFKNQPVVVKFRAPNCSIYEKERLERIYNLIRDLSKYEFCRGIEENDPCVPLVREKIRTGSHDLALNIAQILYKETNFLVENHFMHVEEESICNQLTKLTGPRWKMRHLTLASYLRMFQLANSR
jgi:hypothetical protein